MWENWEMKEKEEKGGVWKVKISFDDVCFLIAFPFLDGFSYFLSGKDS